MLSVRDASISFSRHFSSTSLWAKPSLNPYDTGSSAHDDNCDSMSSRSESTNHVTVLDDTSPALDSSLNSSRNPTSGGKLRRVIPRNRTKVSKTQVILVSGPPG